MTMDPKTIDASAIPITHLNDFLTMGVTDQDVDINKWRLKIHGNLREPMELTLPQIQKLPSVGKKVLMVCPGIFANQGYWKGIDMKALLKNLKPGKDAEKVVFRGLNGGSEKMETFPFADVAEGSVFLAYEVNGVPLPRRHGYPLRIVARDYYGDDWVKYVFDMEVM